MLHHGAAAMGCVLVCMPLIIGSASWRAAGGCMAMQRGVGRDRSRKEKQR